MTRPVPDGMVLLATTFDEVSAANGGLFVVDRREARRVDKAPSTGLAPLGASTTVWRALHLPDAATADGLLVQYTERRAVRGVPMRGWGDIHDVRCHADGRVLVVATYQNAVLALRRLFRPEVVFQAPGEPDASHVNCITMAGGRLYTTAFVNGREYREWHAAGSGAGVLLELPNGRVAATGLDAPHNPVRVREGWLVCNSGTSELLLLDVEPPGRVLRRAEMGGWCRGLAVSMDHFFVGVSTRRTDRCGTGSACIAVVRRSDWRVVERLPLGAPEVYDVCLAPESVLPVLDGGAEEVEELASRFCAPDQSDQPRGDAGRGLSAPDADDSLSGLELRVHSLPRPMKPGSLTHVEVVVSNRSNRTLQVNGARPLTVGWRWYATGGKLLPEGPHDGRERTHLPRDLPPGSSLAWRARVRCPEQSGTYTLCLSLVRELVAWADDVAPAAAPRHEVTIRH